MDCDENGRGLKQGIALLSLGMPRVAVWKTLPAGAHRIFLRSQIAEPGFGRFLGWFRRTLVRTVAGLFVGLRFHFHDFGLFKFNSQGTPSNRSTSCGLLLPRLRSNRLCNGGLRRIDWWNLQNGDRLGFVLFGELPGISALRFLVADQIENLNVAMPRCLSFENLMHWHRSDVTGFAPMHCFNRLL